MKEIINIKKATKRELANYTQLKIKDVQDYSIIIKKKLKIPSKKFIKKEFYDLISNKNALILFAVKDKNFIGYLVGNFIKNPWNKFGYIGDIFTKSEFRKKGIGTKLLKEFEIICRTKKLKEIRLDVNIKNKKARTFYEKEKFKIIKLNMTKDLK
jgi:ribosomal protein S18 acetylase RimI-like enzyme